MEASADQEHGLKGACTVDRAAGHRGYGSLLPMLFLAGVLVLYVVIGFLAYALTAALI